MSRRKVHHYEGVLEEIVKAAALNDGVAISSEVPSRVRQVAIDKYGSWAQACKCAGVKCPSVINRKNIAAPMQEADMSKGILVKKRQGTLCFECGRSGAPISLRCSWDAELVLPEGAVYCKKYLKISNGEIIVLPMVLACPQFISDRDEDFRKLVKDERQRLMRERMMVRDADITGCVKLFERL